MRDVTFVSRLRTAYCYIRYGKNACVMTCGRCGKTFIKSITKHPVETTVINDFHHIDLLWSDVCQCLNCGAVCQEIQAWNFEGEPTKINPELKREDNVNDNKRF